jgi:hypothetical protein
MTASPTTQRLGTHPNPPYLSVPRSNVVVEIAISLAQSQRIDHGPKVLVRCGGCGHRVFDLRADHDGLRSLVATRKCLRCGRLNCGRITRVSGYALSGSDAIDGDWLCECGHYLGRVDAVRGRITVPCRHCKEKVSVIATQAMAVVERVVG